MWAMLLIVPTGALIVEERPLSLFGFVFLCSAGIGVPCVGAGVAGRALRKKGLKKSAAVFYAAFALYGIAAVKTAADYTLTTR